MLQTRQALRQVEELESISRYFCFEFLFKQFISLSLCAFYVLLISLIFFAKLRQFSNTPRNRLQRLLDSYDQHCEKLFKCLNIIIKKFYAVGWSKSPKNSSFLMHSLKRTICQKSSIFNPKT